MATYQVQTDDGSSYQIETEDAPQSSTSAAPPAPAAPSGGPSTLGTVLDAAKTAGRTVANAVLPAETAAIPYALKGEQAVAGALDNAGDTVADKVGQLVPNHPMLGALAGFAVKNLPAAIPVPGAQMGGRLLGPSTSAESAALVDAARSLGVPLTRAEISGSKLPATLESMLEKTPLGTKVLQAFRQRQSAAIDAAQGRLLESQGTTQAPSEVGDAVQSALSDVKAGRQSAKNTVYDYRNSLIPPTTPVPLTGAQSAAQDVLKQEGMAIGGLQNSNVAKIAGDVLNTEHAPNAQWLLDQRNRLSAAINDAGANTPAGAALIKIKNGLDSDFQRFVDGLRTQGEGAPAKYAQKGFQVLPGVPLMNEGQSLQAANDLAKVYNQNYQELSNNNLVQGLLKKNPEKVVDAIFKPQNVTNINAFKAASTPEAFNLAKKSFTQGLIKSKNPLAEIKKFDQETLNAIYSPQDLQKIYQYAIVKAGTKGAEQILNEGRPNTARSLISSATMLPFLNAGKEFIQGNIPGAIGNAAVGTAGLTLPYAATKAYLSGPVTNGINMTVRPAISSAIGRTGTLLSAFQGHLKNHPSNQQ